MSIEVLDLGNGQISIEEQDTCYVVCNDVGVQGAQGVSGFISSIIGLYRIQTTVGGQPTAGHIRYNNATQTSATILTIADVTQDDIDVELFLSLLASGTPLVVQDKDDYTNYQIWEISGAPTENASYFSIPVTLTDSGGTGTTGFANNHQVFVAAFGAGGSTVWGDITGTLSNQTDLQTALNAKVDENASITGATKTKITYDAKGLVTAGADATTADIADSLNRRYVTDAQLTVIGNTSGTNTGDQINITGNAATVTTNANLTGPVTSIGNATAIANGAISNAMLANSAVANLSGTNTGDQTITLTGDVTGSGTGSFAATIANDAVTYAKMQNVSGSDKVLGRISGSGDVEEIACTSAGRALLDDADAAAQVTTLGLDNTKIASIGITIDGGGSAITTGSKGYVYIPYACTINSATLLADQTGSIVIDVKKSTYSGFPTTSSIAASAKPTLSAAQKSTDTTLTGWTTSVAAGDCIEFVVDSITTCTRVHLNLKVTKA